MTAEEQAACNEIGYRMIESRVSKLVDEAIRQAGQAAYERAAKVAQYHGNMVTADAIRALAQNPEGKEQDDG